MNPHNPRTREILERMRFGPRRRGYVPPAGGRGADGRPRVWPKPAAQIDSASDDHEERIASPRVEPARPPAVSSTSRREDDNFPEPPS
jgi:hypothetical protein